MTQPSNNPLYPVLDPRRLGSKLAASVAAALEEEIVRLGWPVGAVVATEADLLDRFAVSPPVLRQAVGILESNKVARMRRGPGGGLVVTAPDETSVGAAVALYLEYLRVQPELVGEARVAIEIACVELAARRITPSDVTGLRALVAAEPGRAEQGDYICFLDVHLASGELSGNPVLSLVLKMLMSLLGARSNAESVQRAADDSANFDEEHHDHVAIVEALAAGDAALARLHMIRHLEDQRVHRCMTRPAADVNTAPPEPAPGTPI
jgi:DNA-binding FadR family transcriptional regulator